LDLLDEDGDRRKLAWQVKRRKVATSRRTVRPNDSYRYDVAGGNHGARISDLPEAEQNEARAHLARWMGVPIAVPEAAATHALSSGAEPPFETLALWRRHRVEHAKKRETTKVLARGLRGP